jgi:hypothetical protein
MRKRDAVYGGLVAAYQGLERVQIPVLGCLEQDPVIDLEDHAELGGRAPP